MGLGTAIEAMKNRCRITATATNHWLWSSWVILHGLHCCRRPHGSLFGSRSVIRSFRIDTLYIRALASLDRRQDVPSGAFRLAS